MTTAFTDTRSGQNNPERLWELFHENSKTGCYTVPPPEAFVAAQMKSMWESLPYSGYPAIKLPTPLPLECTLADVICARESTRDLVPEPLSLNQLGTILHFAYGVTHDYQSQGYGRPFRAVPSGGALYPLELYVHCHSSTDCPLGLHHYNAAEAELRLLRSGDESELIGPALLQSGLSSHSSAILFITAVFDRSTFKYGDRGYRFTLLEAGHVAQNVNLVVTALGLACVNLGGFFDRNIDDYLDLDGLSHSALYMIAIGKKTQQSAEKGSRT